MQNQSEIQGKVERVKSEIGELKRDFKRLTLDTNTTHRYLTLSENIKKVTHDGWSDQDHPYPDHTDRFDVWPQVLCTESLTGRCYWEVEWSVGVDIAVTYRGIRRKGWGDDCRLGYNDKSWSLECGDYYTVVHNREQTVLPVRPSSVSTRVDEDGRRVYRVAVHVDHPAGTLSFYAVSSDTLTHLHTFQTTFTEPLYAGFYMWGRGDLVCLCDSIDIYPDQDVGFIRTCSRMQNQSEIQGKVKRVKSEIGELKRDFQRLTLDTNTTHKDLSHTKKYLWVWERDLDWDWDSYPDHSDRFDRLPQVLCTESLTGRCYWEVWWSGEVGIAVTYRGIRRKGYGDDCLLGYNDKSWSLRCNEYRDEYCVRHNGEKTVLPVRPSSVSTRVDEDGRRVYRVAVHVDHPAGTLSFYAVSSDTLTHLHTFQTTFTEPLYAGFYMWGASSVCLCRKRDLYLRS